jgi:hypothetical protein
MEFGARALIDFGEPSSARGVELDGFFGFIV